MLNIINIRGTNGSGKSTVVRRVMQHYSAVEPHHIEGRRRPIGYECRPPNETSNLLWVPGHYEIACGGCDTIPTVAQAYEQVAISLKNDWDVLFEGIMSQDNQQYMLDWHAEGKYKILVIGLTTTIDDCIAGINARREARGNPKPLDPQNTISRDRSVKKNLVRLATAGIEVKMADRQSAVIHCLQRLGFTGVVIP